MKREDYKVNGASVYPNPTKNELFLKVNKGLFQEFEIVNVVGISWMKGLISNESEETKLDISILPPGIYLMQLKGEDTRWQTIKFVVSE